MNEAAGFTVAGFETLATIIETFMNSEEFSSNFSKSDISNFFSKTCNRFLHSYGQNFYKMRKYERHNVNVAKMLRKCRDTGFFDSSLFYVDSGGFQISIGKLDKEQTDILLDLYYGFIKQEDCFDRAFILDIVPGPGCTIFNSFKDIYDYNLKSYELAKNLPQEARDKIIYINHFRTPKLWRIFNDLLNYDGMFESFRHFATGGIVANMASDVLIPCIIYIIPLMPILIKAKEKGIKEFDFHILGGSNFRDIFFYELIKKHIVEKHDIKVTITYDSSGLFKGLMQARYLNVLEGDISRKLDLREQGLHLRWKGDISRIEKYKNEITLLCNEFNFKPLTKDIIYNRETNSFFREVSVYSMLYMLWMFKRVETLCKSIANKAYEFYLDGDYEEFDTLVEGTVRNLNQGKLTRKQTTKSYSVYNSLNMLNELDLEHCEYLIKKTLSKDEFRELHASSKLLAF